MKWFVYILACVDGTYYTGATNDLQKRLKTHNNGRGAAYTRSRLPVKLIYFEEVFGKSAALKRENQIKKLDRSEKTTLIFTAPASALT